MNRPPLLYNEMRALSYRDIAYLNDHARHRGSAGRRQTTIIIILAFKHFPIYKWAKFNGNLPVKNRGEWRRVLVKFYHNRNPDKIRKMSFRIILKYHPPEYLKRNRKRIYLYINVSSKLCQISPSIFRIEEDCECKCLYCWY